MCNYFGIASKLIEKHVDVNIKDRSGSTPLINAVREENIKAVRYLVTDAHEDINLRDKSSGATALSIAVVKDEFDISDFLITVGKADVNLARFDGVYPLHLAVGNNNLMLVQLLLGAGAKVDVRDKNDKTTLDYAIAGGHYKIECLLRSAMQQEGYGTTNIDTEVNSSAFVG